MARKKRSLMKYLTNSIKGQMPKRVKGVIGMLVEPEDFLTVLAVLDGQDKNSPETIKFYEAFFRRFRLNSHLVDCYMTKEEWHDWTVVLLETSNVLWKLREKFDQSSWLETNKKIHEITFKVLKSFDSEKRNHKECKHCSRLFSSIFSNLATYGKDSDIKELCLPSLEKIKEVCEKNVGVSWHFLTYSSTVEEKINAGAHR